MLQADGKIVLIGDASDLVRFTANGSLDAGFGVNGRIQTGFAFTSALALEPDGKFVVVGYGEGHSRLARYDPDGSLDPSFGANGLVTAAENISFTSVTIRPPNPSERR